MDALERRRLEERIFAEVKTMLEEGDIHYLMRCNRADLMKVLEQELGFLGLYHRDDWETPLLIHKLLEQHLDQLYDDYLKPRVQEKRLNPETMVQMAKAPWIESFTAGVWTLRNDQPQSLDFQYSPG